MAIVRFDASGFEQRWQKGDATLLETAEAHGLTPNFSCRSGVCGSCLTRKLAGDVTYRTPVPAEHADDDVLICCAVPAAGTKELILEL
ncbi:2Fe-2S iron-sulfur cluster-binding protein [Pseudovibrio sp. Tun.PSC04-5.I4]|uniref:2Fe-2S iron-sulfur cluster-binding protein n=1 Tax=Pseudovibrio sp. Tun.PSC04-5.I4 TaxID=1798213 RepID=UPI001FCAB23D|nr:2Fe-2S iron-sulfur cluster-binding protein [Pseudovibrio sp. Tun.PSC04-5.I4]